MPYTRLYGWYQEFARIAQCPGREASLQQALALPQEVRSRREALPTSTLSATDRIVSSIVNSDLFCVQNKLPNQAQFWATQEKVLGWRGYLTTASNSPIFIFWNIFSLSVWRLSVTMLASLWLWQLWRLVTFTSGSTTTPSSPPSTQHSSLWWASTWQWPLSATQVRPLTPFYPILYAVWP